MLTKSHVFAEHGDGVPATLIIRLSLFGICFFRRERGEKAITFRLFGVPIYRVDQDTKLLAGLHE